MPWTWLGKAWSGLVLVRNDRKINFQTQGEPATCNWASALWLQQHSDNAFFGTPCIFFFLFVRFDLTSSALHIDPIPFQFQSRIFQLYCKPHFLPIKYKKGSIFLYCHHFSYKDLWRAQTSQALFASMKLNKSSPSAVT